MSFFSRNPRKANKSDVDEDEQIALLAENGGSSSPSTPYYPALEARNWSDKLNMTIFGACTMLRRGITHPMVKWALIVLLISMSYYTYLASLYFVDEVYDGDKLREYNIHEKFTIRVIAPPHSKNLAKFVEKYSICQAVEEIQVIWAHSPKPPPGPRLYKFSKTHSTVVYEVDPSVKSRLKLGADGKIASGRPYMPTSFAPKLKVRTDAVLLLDADVSVSCQDLTFAHSVWRSGKDSLVGFYPRMHALEEGRGLTYRGPWAVWWNRAYSLLLSHALFVSAALLKESGEDPRLTRALDRLGEQGNHLCYDVALNLFVASRTEGKRVWKPPVLVQPAHAMTRTGEKSSHYAERPAEDSAQGRALLSTCLTELSKALEVRALPYARTKSILASKKIFW